MNSLFSLRSCIVSQLNKANYASNISIQTQPIRKFHVGIFAVKEKKEGPDRYEKILSKDPTRDRSQKVSLETSIRYIESEAFKKGYGDKLVWELYRRNHKGVIPPSKTRKTCIRNDVITTGSPCPICRDEYLVVDYRNIKLLKQFISPLTGEILSYQKTGVCQKQHHNLLVAYLQAKDLGLIKFKLPFRKYDYSEYQTQ